MRFLLLSDTHGRLGVIHELAERVRADAVIHAGDFGLYDDGSYDRLSHRELRLLLVHSNLPRDEKNRILGMPPEGQVTAARSHALAGEFQRYIDGSSSFSVPIYAVWGNHEDKEVVERLYRGDWNVANLNLLHHETVFHAGDALIYGLGGNLLPGAKMLHKPIAGGGGRVWSTLSQYADLVRMIDRESQATGIRIFVSHVSPGKEPFIEMIGARTSARYTVSGHMGAPTCMVWNPFAVQTVEESALRLRNGMDAVRTACLDSAGPATSRVAESFDVIGRLPEDRVRIGRGETAPPWYRSMTHINLPDAHVGFGLLEVDGDTARFQSLAAGS